MRIEIKASILAILTSVCSLALTFGLAPFLRSSLPVQVNGQLGSKSVTVTTKLSTQVEQGRTLFARNCAHCHGDDARGDEGPTLFKLAMSDARIDKRIKEGIKGEMPRFGSKLNEVDIAALIAYLRTLKD